MLACICASLRRSVRLVVRAQAESCVVVDGEATERSLCLRGSDQSSAEQHAHRVIESVGALPSRHWTRAESSRMTDSSLTTLERFACRIAATWGGRRRALQGPMIIVLSRACGSKDLVGRCRLPGPLGVPGTQRHADLCALLRCGGRCPALAGRRGIPVDPPCAGGFKAGRRWAGTCLDGGRTTRVQSKAAGAW